jgi:hypothetical protein
MIKRVMTHSSNGWNLRCRFDSIFQPKKRTIIHNIVIESFAAELAII